MLGTAEGSGEDGACFVVLADMIDEETDLLDARFCVKVREIETAIPGGTMDNVATYCGHNATFLEGGFKCR